VEQQFRCPAGEFLNGLTVRYGDITDSISAYRCSSSSSFVSTGLGGNGGPVDALLPDGACGLNAAVVSYLDLGSGVISELQFTDCTTTANVVPGTSTYGGTGPGVTVQQTIALRCPVNTQLVGIAGTRSTFLSGLGIICGGMLTNFFSPARAAHQHMHAYALLFSCV
jgi:hypothetical protein